jgi:hypothetical protein
MKSVGIFIKRGLKKDEAAAYIGVGTTKFDELVARGDMPKGFLIDSARVWDVLELDKAFEALKGTPVRSKRGRTWDDIHGQA